ncbi:MAG TPA: RNA polymerase sigma factor [Candidatus Paceibacterota bacterium]|nr:RNA polymerase sigma factor [Candidatus Paceibacterota bacterium]
MAPDARTRFLKAYDEYADAIYRHCYYRVYSKEKAEELMQETFLRAWQYVEKGTDVGNIRALLYRIATNLIIDASRRQKEESLDAMIEESPAAEPVQGGRELEEKNIFLKDAIAALKDLPSDYGAILTMRYIDDLDIVEIAEALDLTPNHVSVKINRATKALKDKLHYS